ncbi:hypothetical protein V6259_12915 [Marinomonas sp. TI.3.20]|uniref:hypothetical protein n=1 Tax=Marinomonas sp. TI.3.20 TaxID=3121296 RepID=UPI00311EAC71
MSKEGTPTISMIERQEMQMAYRLAVKKNKKLTLKLLSDLHKKPKHIIEKWVYTADRYPNFQACFELERFIRALRGELPIELSRIINRSKIRVNETIKTIEKNPLSEFKITGNRIQKGKKASTILIYNSQKVSITEIAESKKMKVGTLYSRLRKNNLLYDSADVTEIVDNYKVKLGRPRKALSLKKEHDHHEHKI